MFGKKKQPKGEKTEIHSIASRLDDGESVVLWVRQSRIKPGGAAIMALVNLGDPCKSLFKKWARLD